MNTENVKDVVREKYGQVAHAPKPAAATCCGPSCCH
jgi:hypothetical protein